jgi:hypothetical protein
MKVKTPDVPEVKKPTQSDTWDEIQQSILDSMREAGYVVNEKDGYAQIHIGGFLYDHKKNRRLGSFSATTGDTDKQTPNGSVRPLKGVPGGLLVTRYNKKSDTPDWKWSAKKQKLYAYYNVKPEIKITSDLTDMVEQTERALGQHSNLFQHGGLPVDVRENDKAPPQCLFDNGSCQFHTLSDDGLRLKAAEVIDFKKHNKTEKAYLSVFPPKDIVNSVMALTNYPHIRPVIGIVSAPIMRKDGSIVATRGYDDQTGVLLDVHGTYPAIPSVVEAKNTLDDVLCDFPFAGPAYKSACTAALVSLLCRHAYSGPTPFFLFDGNVPGIGKGLLTNLLITIAQGLYASRYSWPTGEDERRKLITTVAMSGSLYLYLDNLKGLFGGATIEAELTADVWKDRLLGLNKEVNLPIAFITMGTANNCRLTTDLTRRTVATILQSDLEDPSTRTVFKHPHLLEYTKQRRAELVMAALSIPYHYIKAGSPDQRLPGFGSYEAWSDLVRSSLVWARYADCDTRSELAANNDDEKEILRQLLDGWEELGKESTVAEAIEASETAPTLKALLKSLPMNRASDALGKLLRDNQNRTIDGRRIVKGKKAKITRWKVEDVAV